MKLYKIAADFVLAKSSAEAYDVFAENMGLTVDEAKIDFDEEPEEMDPEQEIYWLFSEDEDKTWLTVEELIKRQDDGFARVIGSEEY